MAPSFLDRLGYRLPWLQRFVQLPLQGTRAAGARTHPELLALRITTREVSTRPASRRAPARARLKCAAGTR